jgi:nucleoside-diphosphate-sugar epimerase
VTTFLVSGGDGFIGSHLVEALLRQGGRVRVLDNLFARGGANLDYLQALGGHLEAVVDDIRSSEACRRACQGVDYVFHQAGLGSVPRSVEDPVESHEINATGTLKILQAAKEAGVRRFVWASSSSVYGDQEPADGPKVETMLPHPASPYGAAKLMGEHYARLFHSLYGFPTVSLRYFNVFGPRQDPHSPYAAVVPKFIQALKAGQRPVVFGDGRQSRDFTYIANVVEANLKALTAAGAPGLVFNVAQGET